MITAFIILMAVMIIGVFIGPSYGVFLLAGAIIFLVASGICSLVKTIIVLLMILFPWLLISFLLPDKPKT